MGKTYTGFDIGSRMLKIAVYDGNIIKDMAMVPMPDGMVSDGRIVSANAMGDFIKEAAASVKGTSRLASFIVPQANSLTRRLQIPAMTVKELDINLPYEFRDYITQGKDKYYYDYAVLHSTTLPDGTPESFDILAVAAAKQTIADYISMFRRAGFKLVKAMPIAVALQNLIKGNPRAMANCCIVEFSYSSTVLNFFTDGSYDVSRAIDTGLGSIDQAIANAQNVDIHTAESYRQTNFQNALENEAVRAVYDQIGVEVGRAMNFYGFNNPTASIEMAYLSGQGMVVPSLVDAVTANIDIEMIDIAEIMPPAAHNENLLTLCPEAVGATMG